MKCTLVKGNTWALEGSQLVGLYQIDDKHCILLDPGGRKQLPEVESAMQELGLSPVGVICTHMHYDHHENTTYFQTTYGAKACLPQGEADIIRNERSLKNHLFCFPPTVIHNTPRLQHLIGTVDTVIGATDTEVTLCGVTFGVLHTPGHSPDHICIVTPDNVCFVGDAFMTEEVLETAMLPFVFTLQDDLESKAQLRATSYDAYLLCHNGIVYGSAEALIEKNISRIYEQLAACQRLITKPMTYSECHQVITRELKLSVGHPVRALYLERYIRPYLDALVDRDAVSLIEWDGAAALAPKE